MKRIIPYAIACAASLQMLAAEPIKNGHRTTFIEEWGLQKEAKAEMPIGILAEFDAISKGSRTRDHSHNKLHKLGYSQQKVLGTYSLSHNELNGLTVGAGYFGSNLHTSGKSPVNQKHFHNALFNIGAYTKEMERWRWDATLELQMNTDHFELSRYTLLTGILNGRYAWKPHSNLYAGLLGYSGLRFTRLLPIIGFDYKTEGKWRYNAIFPINISAIYSLTNQLTVDLGLRSFLSRQRLGKHDEIRRGFVTYRNLGAEVGLNYKCNDQFNINLYAGESFAGRLRVSDHNNRNRHHWQFKPSPYLGLLAHFNF